LLSVGRIGGPFKARRMSVLAAIVAATCASSWSLAAGAGEAAPRASTAPPSEPRASAARSISVKDEGRLRLVKSSGSQVIDEGPATGTIPGKARIVFVYNGNPAVSAQITIAGQGGTMKAHATGHLSNPSSASPSFKGALTITAGGGRYAHAHGSGQLFGVFYRRSYAITVQTQGTLDY
jgi:hypothetical protein